MEPTSFRAYTAAAGERAFVVAENGVPVPNEQGAPTRAVRLWDVEDVAFEGPTTDGLAKFDAGDTAITKVVFYSGEGDDAVVVGQAPVNTAGKIRVACEEPAPPQPVVFDERTGG
jgi:hypothetical protein